MNDKVLSLDLDDPNQLSEKESGPVECLGKTFENDQARRDYYLAILAEKLKDPEFRKIEGFPIGADEDILNLSDPPYYTACPNPFLNDFICLYGRPYDSNEEYKREPYAADVSEGKYDPIYKFHPYPTKVPHKAIMRYILHFTNPGDLVFDGFCGTGMTGVAAQMCGNKEVVESLGYKVLSDGTILRLDTDTSNWVAFSKLGARVAVLNDLSPSASFISYNYNTPEDAIEFSKIATKLLKQIHEELGWMFETKNSEGVVGKINYTVFSEVFICNECASEIVFWDAAVDQEAGKVKEVFPCTHCGSALTKKKLDRAWSNNLDIATGNTKSVAKIKPVLINYSIGSGRFEKIPDNDDLKKLEEIESRKVLSWFPTSRMMEGKETRRNDPFGLTHVHDFYFRRNLEVLSRLSELIPSSKFNLLITKVTLQITKLYRYTYQSGVWGAGGGPLSGTLYVPSLIKDLNIFNQLESALSSRKKIELPGIYENYIGGCQSSTTIQNIPDNSLDYIFIDPPFGSNLYYSELAFLWESWLRVLTSNKEEAIENSAQNKGINEYRYLIEACFKEAYRILKPGRWMTVEFSNTQSNVWNTIQIALLDAGFLIANVSALDKQKGSFKVVTTPTAVKQDLVISAYKPKSNFDKSSFDKSSEDGVWDFIRSHLGYLPIIKREGNELVKVPERDPRILFDQVVAYFVRNMRDVPLSSKEFQNGLIERFSERDGMIFLPEQVAQYDKARMSSTKLRQLSIFVHDEASAIDWLRQLLLDKPQTYQDIQPKFMSELAGWKKAEVQLELIKLLEQNFLKFNGQGLVPAQIHSYLSTNFKELRGLEKDDPELLAKAKDRWFVPDPNNEEQLQALRERDLLKQFEEYKTFSGKKIKQVRMEAVRAGFKKAWKDRDYETIIHIAEKIPESLLQEDEKLLMWYDQAQTRHGNTGFF